MKPIVFIAVGDQSVVVVTPNSSHTPESWIKVEQDIRTTYIEECIMGHPGRCPSLANVLDFFGRHPEWDCTFSEGVAVRNHMLVE
jgi:hypothetical protein